jgi:hypothetical protein
MLAQRYPDAYDGIAASALAINFACLLPALAWLQVAIKLPEKFPLSCKLDALTASAIATCDLKDSIINSLISNPAACLFNPFSIVSELIDCDHVATIISNAAATIANLTWTGP